MKVFLTGANGYIGMRLLPCLLDLGHEVVCAVRDRHRLSLDGETLEQITVVEIDFLEEYKEAVLPHDIDVAYYLLHSMSTSTKDFDEQETICAENFNRHLADTQAKQVIYLSGIVNDENLSKHLWSRHNVERILGESTVPLTTIRSGIIVGSGSSSFEIIRDLCEKLPLMITPKWVDTPTQPIAVRDVIVCMMGVLGREDTFGEDYDVGGPEVMTYKQMLLQYSAIREMPLAIYTVPVMTPRLSSYWLYFVTSTSYKLAINLVDSMKVPVICRDQRLQEMLGVEPISYARSIELAFQKIEQNQVVSSWKDSLIAGRFKKDLHKYLQVPSYGCLQDKQTLAVDDADAVLERIWAIGGETGWYYGDFLWRIRGFLDKLFGGVGLRRGRTHKDDIFSGDVLDFWRVLIADKEAKRLLLFAEMRVPGEAWLEFTIGDDNVLRQTATFRPRGIWGRLYWYALVPLHYFVFGGMIRNIVGEHAG